ncbi:MAG: polysaccharide deacetylase, partial [Anaerolineaceae bacterium]|nr:polysaccharide deacetylase [Anaerolineaceae bacterium]
LLIIYKETKMKWPNNAQCTVLLTFDFDGELMWNSYPQTPAYKQRGQYGANVGIPRILKLLKEHKIPATFFWPGANAESYPDLLKEVYSAGHDIGHHGYLHEKVGQIKEGKEKEIMQKGMDAIEKVLGITPKGYRSPAWDLTNASLALFKDFDLLYDSSLMGNDFDPYMVNILEKKTNVVELPISWELDDAPYCQFLFHPYRSGLAAPSRMFEIWSAEFKGAYKQGGVITFTMHPQIIGRVHRLNMLDKLINYMKSFPGVWFATCTEASLVIRDELGN